MRRARFLLALLASAAFVQAAQEPVYDLLWKPKPEQTLRYRMTMDLDIPVGGGMEVPIGKIGFEMDVRAKVLKVETNGDYEMETVFSNGKMRVGDETHPFEEGDKAEVTRYNAKGEEINPKKEDEDEDTLGGLLGAMISFTPPEKPVKTGDKWSKDVKADSAKDVRAARLEYEVVGPEKSGDFDAVRVNYTYRELDGSKPTTAKGAFLIDVKDATPIRFETTAENVRMDEDMEPGTMTLKMVRQ